MVRTIAHAREDILQLLTFSTEILTVRLFQKNVMCLYFRANNLPSAAYSLRYPAAEDSCWGRPKGKHSSES